MGEYIAIGVGVVVNLLALAYFLGGLKETVRQHGHDIRDIKKALGWDHIAAKSGD